MHAKLMQMMAKKKDAKPMSEMEKKAKLDSVNELRDAAQEAMGGKLDGLKKVSVLSDSSQGLKHGLDKARQVMSGAEDQDLMEQAESNKADPFEKSHDELSGHMNPHDERSKHMMSEGGDVESEESPEHEASESPEEESSEHEEDDMSEDEINQELERLMELKKKMESKRS